MTPTPDSPPIQLLATLTACPRCRPHGRGTRTVEPRDVGDDDWLQCGECGRLFDPAPETVALLRAHGVDDTALGAAVEATAVAHARHINSGGLDAQIPYLNQHRGLAELDTLLRRRTDDANLEPRHATAHPLWHCGVCNAVLQSDDPERPRCETCNLTFAVDPGVQELVAPDVVA